MVFTSRVRSGVAVVNGATYGSEPHLPFGGLGESGNGWREAGTEALDVYSDWKTVYINYDPIASVVPSTRRTDREHLRRGAHSRPRRLQAAGRERTCGRWPGTR